MKKIGIALIAIILCTSLLIACTPGYTLDRFFSFLGGSATGGNAEYYATDGNVIFVSAGNIASFGNAPVATNGNAVATAGNAAVATSGNAALPAFTVDQSAPSDNLGGFATPTPAPVG